MKWVLPASGAPSRKGYVVDCERAKESDKRICLAAPPPPLSPLPLVVAAAVTTTVVDEECAMIAAKYAP